MRHIVKTSITLTLLLIAACASKQSLSRLFSDAVFDFSDIQVEKTPTQEEYPETDVVCLLREGKYQVFHKISTFSEHVVIKVISGAGKKYANVKIPFWEEWEILDMKARTIRPDGEIISLAP